MDARLLELLLDADLPALQTCSENVEFEYLLLPAQARHYRKILREFYARPLLSKRQRQVLQLTTAGMTCKEIAYALGIRITTVKNHFTSIYGLLGARDRTQAVVIALQKHIIHP
jgi:DNA-binding NarL/FixJ family response regulator